MTNKPIRVSIISLLFIAGQLHAQTQSAPESESGQEMDLGPGSVPSQIKEIEKARSKERRGWPSIPSFKQYNLSVAADYQFLAQRLDDSPSEESAVSGVARLYGTWKVNPESSSPGRLIFKVENRHLLGTDLTPQELLPSAGAATVSGPTFNDKKAVLTNLYWGQSFRDNEFGYIAGIIDPADFIDVYGLVNVWTEFNNLAFATNPTIPVPSQGLGAAGRWLMPSNFYITGSVSDSNANPHRPDEAFDSFFNTAEYLTHIEFGRIGSWEDRWAENMHVTLWHVDAREEVGLASDWGGTISISKRYGAWLPFLRAGYADRGVSIQKKTISTGSGYTVNDKGDYIGVGLSWGQAANSDRDQYTVEGYYKWQVFSHILVVPSIQWINNPAHNPSEDQQWLAALKCRFTF